MFNFPVRRKKPKYWRSLIILLVIAGMLFCTGCSRISFPKKDIYVIFRYDDYSAISDTDFETKILETFKEHMVPVTVGVIPFIVSGNAYDPGEQPKHELTKTKIATLQQYADQGVVDVALHGYAHQVFSVNKQSEFAGMPLALQEEVLRAGKDFLEEALGVRVNTFIPPWNAYDANTLKALEDTGFSILSANKAGVVDAESSLRFIPSTCTLADVQKSISSVKKLSYSQPLMVVLFHDYDFKEVDNSRGITTFQELSTTLDWLDTQRNVHIITLDQSIKQIDDLSASRYQRAQENPPSLVFVESTYSEEQIADNFYRESTISIKTWIVVIGFYLLFCLVGGLLAYLFGSFVFRKRKSSTKFILVISFAALLLLAFYIFRDPYVYRNGMILFSFSLGIVLGLAALIIKMYKFQTDSKNMVIRS